MEFLELALVKTHKLTDKLSVQDRMSVYVKVFVGLVAKSVCMCVFVNS